MAPQSPRPDDSAPHADSGATATNAGSRPQSAASSRRADAGDQDGDGDDGGPQARTGPPSHNSYQVPSVTGPVGEPGLPPSRPSSAATNTTSSRHPNFSRRGMVGPYGPPSAAGSTGGQSTRPPTAGSRTHVPSIAAQGFFKPMSSQRLQAQRARPTSLLGRASASNDGKGSDAGSRLQRADSNTSSRIQGRGPAAVAPASDRPLSQATDVSESIMGDFPDRTTANATPTGNVTVISEGESEAPLQKKKQVPAQLDTGKAQTLTPGDDSKPQKSPRSPRSFRDSFNMLAGQANRRSRNSRGSMAGLRSQGHEKLQSTDSTPTRVQAVEIEKRKAQVKKDLGKNYDYFTGNTVFCWGGRLQNSRDRPINIATGAFVVIPAGLFFGFS